MRTKVINQNHGDRFSLYNADCVEALEGMPDNSIHHINTSVPFSNLYVYSPSLRDMGNNETDEMFFNQFDYLVPELWRVTVPGRVAAIHCKQLSLFKGRDEVAGLRDFPGELRRRFCGTAIDELIARLEAFEEARSLLAGFEGDLSPLDVKIRDVQKELIATQKQSWIFHGMVTIWKCPKTEMMKTNNHGLLHTQLVRDSSVSRPGMAEYVYLFRKWSDEMNGINSVVPVTRWSPEEFAQLKKEGREHKWSEYVGSNPALITNQGERDYSIRTWQKYASPVWNDVWMDIDTTKVLNQKMAMQGRTKHTCPMQVQVVERLIEWFTNPNEIVLDPFNGIGTAGVSALKMDRKYVGFELDPGYFSIAVDFLKEVENSEQLNLLNVIA